jgi:UDP-N-acetyl-D-glucosamine dehydrogenase
MSILDEVRAQASPTAPALYHRHEAAIGIVGLGYVGLPLALAACRAGYRTLGFDIDPEKISEINAGRSYIGHITSSTVEDYVRSASFSATADFQRLGEVDAVVVCVPTPLTRNREPNISYIVATAEAIACSLRTGQLIIIESTSFPGTTMEVVKPILEYGGLKSGRDFFLAYCPEREDPGNSNYPMKAVPKIVSGDGEMALELASALYREIFARVIPVSSPGTAEAVKLTENIFRAVNIGLINELKLIFERMDIDIWEVIEAAKTKPYGFMPFYPGPGLGGHCIPVDPFYLTWKAREYDISSRFIEVAGEINLAMPHHVTDRLIRALGDRFQKSVNRAKILLLGVAYKKNIGDTRLSPALQIYHLLESHGALVAYYDPFVPELPPMRDFPRLSGRRSVCLDSAQLSQYDAVIICTDHDVVDYEAIVSASRLVLDTRNATRRVRTGRSVIVKA